MKKTKTARAVQLVRQGRQAGEFGVLRIAFIVDPPAELRGYLIKEICSSTITRDAQITGLFPSDNGQIYDWVGFGDQYNNGAVVFTDTPVDPYESVALAFAELGYQTEFNTPEFLTSALTWNHNES